MSHAERLLEANTGAERKIATLIERMRAGVERSPEIYHPGAFWDGLIATSLKMLETEGITSFNRTVSNNYYNWLVTTLREPQMKHVARQWLRRPTLAPLLNRLETTTGLRTTTEDRPFGLSGGPGRRYKLFVGALWEIARRHDPLRLTESSSLNQSGNLIRIWQRGRLISQDLANYSLGSPWKLAARRSDPAQPAFFNQWWLRSPA